MPRLSSIIDRLPPTHSTDLPLPPRYAALWKSSLAVLPIRWGKAVELQMLRDMMAGILPCPLET